MTDKTDPPAEPPEGADAEKHFWTELETRTKATLDSWFDDKVKTVQTQRGPGRQTLPKILADLFFPVKD